MFLPTQINDQVLLLSEYGSISHETSANHLSLCKLLSSHIKHILPSFILLPFGSLITGHGTTTSDCDISVLTSPPYLRDILSPEKYFPQHLQSESLQALESNIPEDPCSPVTVSTDTPIAMTTTPITVRQDSDPDSSCSSAVSTPERRDSKDISPVFRKLEVLIRSLPDIVNVVAIRAARCPILRFYHQPTKLHADISIDNRLASVLLCSVQA